MIPIPPRKSRRCSRREARPAPAFRPEVLPKCPAPSPRARNSPQG